MEKAVEIILALVITIALCAVAYKGRLLTRSGIAAAFACAMVIACMGSFWWLVSFLVFPIIAFIATRLKFGEKRSMGLQEGKHGERDHMNVLGVALVPAVIAAVYFFRGDHAELPLAVAFLSAVAVSMADTTSSEIGVLDRKTWMITTMKRIEPGPNGGVSRLGMASSLVTSALFAVVSWLLIYGEFDPMMAVVAACGMLGNVLDSVVGAVWENKGKISKYGNNCLTAFAGAVVGFLLCVLIQ